MRLNSPTAAAAGTTTVILIDDALTIIFEPQKGETSWSGLGNRSVAA